MSDAIRGGKKEKKDVVNKKARQRTGLFHVALIFVVVGRRLSQGKAQVRVE